MRTPLIVLAALGLSASVHAQQIEASRRADGGHVARFGGAHLDQPQGVALDDTGAVYTVGQTSSDFVGAQQCRHAPCSRAFLLKISPKGQVVWRRALSPSGDAQVGQAVVWDAPRRRVLVAGTYFDPAGPGFQQTVFAAAYDSAGAPLWRRDFGAEDSRSDRAVVKGLAVAPDGAVVLVGDTGGDLAGARHIGRAYNGAHNGWDVFVLKLKPSGQTAWVRMFGVGDPDPDRASTQYNDYVNAVAVGADGRIWLGGGTSGDLIKHRKRRAWRHYLMALQPNGKRPRVWYRARTEPWPQALAFGANGTLYELGVSDRGLRAIQPGLAQADLTLSAISARGARQWGVRFGTDRRDYAAGLAAGPDGTLFVGNVAGLHARPDAELYAFSPKGRLLWRREVASRDVDEATGVAASHAGVALVGASGGPHDGLRLFDHKHAYVPADGFVLRYPLRGPQGRPVN